MKLFRSAPGQRIARSLVIAAGAFVAVFVSGAGCSNSSQGPQVLPKKFPGAAAPKGASAAKSPPKTGNS